MLEGTSLRDIETHYSIMDVVYHNDALDLKHAVQAEQHERQLEKMKDGR